MYIAQHSTSPSAIVARQAAVICSFAQTACYDLVRALQFYHQKLHFAANEKESKERGTKYLEGKWNEMIRSQYLVAHN